MDTALGLKGKSVNEEPGEKLQCAQLGHEVGCFLEPQGMWAGTQLCWLAIDGRGCAPVLGVRYSSPDSRVFCDRMGAAQWSVAEGVFATCLGLVYIYARYQYFWGYSEDAKKRITGFRLSLGVLALLTILGAVGIANSFLDEYLDFNVAKKLRHL
ncbi:Microsomal glutathione S-transferase 2-like protein [Camelus ferus]|nr:Microsomal glutathione S-transferase 2-like protein [Camelus ferus]